MKAAETVTFGGAGYDRIAQLRGSDALQALETKLGAAVIVFWQGKPLVQQTEDGEQLVRIPSDDPLVRDHKDSFILLGQDQTLLYALSLEDWQPTNQDLSSVGQFTDHSRQEHPLAPQGSGFAELRTIMAQLSPLDAELAATGKALISWHESNRFCANCGTPTVMAKSGWQRDCPNCKRSHFPRTDPVVIMLITHGNSVLMGRSHGWPEGMYSLLAGFVEPGETIEAAVRRETYEEAGIKTGPVTYLASQPWPFPASLMIGCYGQAISDKIKVDPEELDDAVWVSREDMLIAHSGHHPWLKPARKGSIAQFLIGKWLEDCLD